MNISAIGFVVRMAAAGAEEFRPAVDAVRFAEDVIHAEIMHHLHIFQTFVHVADHIAFAAHELVAWINVAIRHYGQVLMAGAAAAQTLRQARALPQIHIEMEEEERTTFLFSLDEKVRQAVIFRFHRRQVFLFDGVIGTVFAHHRFHGNRGEALVDHVFYVGGEVHVVTGERAPNIVFLALAVRHAVLEILQDFIIGAFAVDARTHAVMHFLAAIERKDQADVIVGEILHLFLIQEHAIGGEGHLDFLMMLLFLLLHIVHRLLHHVPIHEWFAAKEIELAVFTRAAVSDEEIHRSSSHVEAHEHTPLAVAALSGEAILAAQIAVVSDIDAQRLDDRTVLNSHFVIRIHRRKERFLRDELIQIIHDFIELGFLIVLRQIRQNHSPIGSIVISQDLVCHIIDDMHDAAIHIHDDIHAVLLETVDHWLNIVIHEI